MPPKRRREAPNREPRSGTVSKPEQHLGGHGTLEHQVSQCLCSTIGDAERAGSTTFGMKVATGAEAIGVSKQAEDLDLRRQAGAPAVMVDLSRVPTGAVAA